jgi:hypothetical protein
VVSIEEKIFGGLCRKMSTPKKEFFERIIVTIDHISKKVMNVEVKFYSIFSHYVLYFSSTRRFKIDISMLKRLAERSFFTPSVLPLPLNPNRALDILLLLP